MKICSVSVQAGTQQLLKEFKLDFNYFELKQIQNKYILETEEIKKKSLQSNFEKNYFVSSKIHAGYNKKFGEKYVTSFSR